MAFKDLSRPLLEDNIRTPKYKRLFATTNSVFLYVKCGVCNTLNVCFSHSQKRRDCKGCQSEIQNQSGGRALIDGNCLTKQADGLCDNE